MYCARGRYVAPRHRVWSTDGVDLSDPFQRRWFMRQVLLHGRSEDVRELDLEEVAVSLDELRLPADLYRLWKRFLETRGNAVGQEEVLTPLGRADGPGGG